jgi:LmbE family N-acetylglucosaminyl deacetylase
MNKIMIVAAHPDDDILGCGGIMQKYSKSGSIIKVIFIGEGSSCRFEKPDSKDALKEIEKRNEDGRNALNFLGIEKYEFYNLPCGRLDQVPQIEINKILEKKFQTLNLILSSRTLNAMLIMIIKLFLNQQ